MNSAVPRHSNIPTIASPTGLKYIKWSIIKSFLQKKKMLVQGHWKIKRPRHNPIKPGGVIFARDTFKCKTFLIDLWYEPETLWLFLTFNRNYFAAKENWQ